MLLWVSNTRVLNIKFNNASVERKNTYKVDEIPLAMLWSMQENA